MNLRAKPNVMNQVINRRKCHMHFYTNLKVESVMASLWELGPVIFGPTEDFVSWLQNKGLLASSRTCSSCSGAVMRLGKRVMSVMVVYGDVPSARLLRVFKKDT